MLSTTAVSNVRKLRRSRAAVSIACCAIMLVLASGCQTDKDKPGAGATPVDHASKPTAASGGPNQPASGQRASAFRSPLTGLGSEREVRERPVAVMVENAPQARPQSGLDQADIVYEVLAEGEITRFVAVYQSGSPSVIGPVRSIRPYFVKLGEGFDAMIVHAGWSQDAMDLIVDHNLNHLDEVYGDGAYYWRSKDRKAPHNLYTSMENIRKAAVNKKFRADWSGASPVFASSVAAAAPTPQQGASGTGATAASAASGQGQAAQKVTIPYIRGYNVSYTYDAAAKLYSRFMENKPHTDKESGKQLTATNILVVESKHQVLDNEGRREVDVDGPGKGYLIQAGTMQQVTWQRKDGIIRAYNGSKELPLLPGQTWVQIVPENWGIQVE